MTERLIYVTPYCSPLTTAVQRRTWPKINSHLPRDVQAAWVIYGLLMLWSWARCPGFPSTCQRGKIEELRFAWWSHYFQQTIAICAFSVDSLSAFCLQDVSSLYLICIIIKNSVSSFQMQFFSTWSLEIIPASFKNGSTYEAATWNGSPTY